MSNKRYDALLLLAGIISAEGTPSATAATMPSSKPGHSGPGRPQPNSGKKRQREGPPLGNDLSSQPCEMDCVEDCVECSGGAPIPAVLMQAKDPNRSGWLWPVVTANMDDLPASVADGGCNAMAKRIGFPLSFEVSLGSSLSFAVSLLCA